MAVTRRGGMARLGLMLVISAVAGLVVAGVLLPIVGGVGLAARAGATSFDALPTALKEPPLAQVTRLVDDQGHTFATFYYQDRVTVSLAQVPIRMRQAIVAIEDVRFYEHHGVDLKGTLRALLHNGSQGAVSQGGSTLTQQYVKNVLIESATTPAAAAAARADTLSRKAQEARYALALEQKLTKDQILERYLNIAYFGDGAYGIGTAAVHYFGVPVQRLTLPQEAMLAGLVQSPDAYDPALHPKAARARRDVVLQQMDKYGFISDAEYSAAVTTPVTLHLHKQGNGCEASSYPWFCDYVQHVVEQTPGLGTSALLRGGLTIHTTLDLQDQKAADTAMHSYVPARNSAGVAGAEALVEPGTGAIKAISVSTAYGNGKGQTTVDYAVDTKYGGGTGRWPAGSTFKLFVLAAALKQGIGVHTTIYAPHDLVNYAGYTDCNGDHLVYSPKVSNAGESEAGTYDLVTGTWDSVNTFYAQLEERTGLCAPTQLAADMGVTQANGQPIAQVPSFVLGANPSGFSPLDVAGAYATIAAHGTFCPPVAVSSVTSSSGKTIYTAPSQCHQVLDPGIADTIASILQGVLTEPGATAVDVGEPGRPAAAKTGTADNYIASNFAGFVPQLASFVWVGKPPSSQVPLSYACLAGHCYGQEVFGATIAGPIWKATFEAALQGVPVQALPSPSQSVVQGQTTPIPDVGGETISSAMAALRQAGFAPIVGSARDSLYPAGTVAFTSPGAGVGGSKGETVVVYPSTGVAPAPTPTRSTGPGPTPSQPAPKPKPTPSGKGKKPKP